MDQAIKRKRKVIVEKCMKHKSKNDKGFMMIEMKVFNSGQTEVRLMGTEIKSKVFLQCALGILNRTRFKESKKGTVTRIYRFFIQ